MAHVSPQHCPPFRGKATGISGSSIVGSLTNNTTGSASSATYSTTANFANSTTNLTPNYDGTIHINGLIYNAKIDVNDDGTADFFDGSGGGLYFDGSGNAIFSNSVRAVNIYGNGLGLTNLNASSIVKLTNNESAVAAVDVGADGLLTTNAIPSGGGVPVGGSLTNVTNYGNANKTNWTVTSPAGFLVTNANGSSVTISSGGVTASGVFTGNGSGLTNIPSSSITGAYNRMIFVTNNPNLNYNDASGSWQMFFSNNIPANTFAKVNDSLAIRIWDAETSNAANLTFNTYVGSQQIEEDQNQNGAYDTTLILTRINSNTLIINLLDTTPQSITVNFAAPIVFHVEGRTDTPNAGGNPVINIISWEYKPSP
jgi:hypothetical protein